MVKRRTIAQYIEPSSVFIETGTYFGKTAVWASRHCETVHTIELSDSLYAKVSPGLKSRGIHAHHGDSMSILPGILDSITSGSVMIWLDAHWSGGVTARAHSGDTPVVAELQAIESWFQSRPGIRLSVLIDDLRDFDRDDAYPDPELLLQFSRRNGMDVSFANDIFAATSKGQVKT